MRHAIKIIVVLAAAVAWLDVGAAQEKDAGVIGHWGFNEGQGDITADLSGNGNPGKIFNGSWVAHGISGKALKLNGVDAYIDCGTSTIFNISRDFSVELWVKIFKFDKGAGLVSKGNHSNGWQFYIYKTFIAFVSKGLGAHVFYRRFVYGTFYANPFNHIVVTGKADGESIKIIFYIDGQPGATFSQPNAKPPQNNAPLLIGGYASAEAGNFAGIIDEVAIYNRALTEKEVKSRYDKLAQY